MKRYRGDWSGAALFLAIVALIAFIAWGILVTLRPAIGQASGLVRDGAEQPGTVLLARMAYSEARSDGVRGMTAVSHVALNRLKQPERFGRTLAAVLRAPRQFAVGPVRRSGDPDWQRALWVASGAMQGTLPDPTGGATYFIRCDMKRKPAWTRRMVQTLHSGKHCFSKATFP